MATQISEGTAAIQGPLWSGRAEDWATVHEHNMAPVYNAVLDLVHAAAGVDILEVGSGGGSIARLDSKGQLHVGPESAGSTPGPVCYGRGGTEPTVTDANLILGRINEDNFLGGELRLDRPAAMKASQSRFETGRAARRNGRRQTVCRGNSRSKQKSARPCPISTSPPAKARRRGSSPNADCRLRSRNRISVWSDSDVPGVRRSREFNGTPRSSHS